jgi:hypothetical protein
MLSLHPHNCAFFRPSRLQNLRRSLLPKHLNRLIVHCSRRFTRILMCLALTLIIHVRFKIAVNASFVRVGKA